MQNVDMHALIYSFPNNVTVNDLWAIRNGKPKTDETYGGTNDITDLSIINNDDNSYTVSYRRLLDTGDKFDKVINLDTLEPLCFAWGNPPFQNHKANKYIISGFRINKRTLAVTFETSTKLRFIDFHGVGMVIIWTLFSFISYISIRFFKHYELALWVHRICAGFIGLLSTILGIVAWVIIPPRDKSPGALQVHHLTVYVFVIFAVIQSVCGLINVLLIYSKFNNGTVQRFKVFHKVYYMNYLL